MFGLLFSVCCLSVQSYAQDASDQADRSVQEAAKVLLAEQATAGDRLKAAELLVTLSQWGRADATKPLLASLAKDQSVETRRATLSALADTSGELPGDGVIEALLALMDTPLGELEPDWARVLGRYELERVADGLAKITRSADTASEQQRLALRALGEHRRPFAAKVLIDLVSDETTDAKVRGWAFDALARLSHQPQLDRDAQAWQGWYKKARRMNASQWQRMLHENLLRVSRDMADQDKAVRDRLTQSQRALYRVTPAEQRPALLITMLQDDIDGIRSLGIELAQQLAEDNGEFGPELRSELRARLQDSLPRVREASATLLGQLLDQEAAGVMAQRLMNDKEPQRAVKRAFLRALSQMPQSEALQPAAGMLSDPQLQASAAGMLAAAQRAALGDDAFWNGLLDEVNQTLKGVKTPGPQMVTLLGLVIEENDEASWSRIRGWLKSDDERVREAAARSWANGGRALLVLAERSDDAVIRPIALKAVAEAGKDDKTLSAIAARRPAEPEDVRMWDQALVAMAGRVTPAALLGSIQGLAKTEADTRQTRENMLTAAIEQIAAADPPAAPTRDALALLIARAQTRVLADAPALVVLDYEAALAHDKLLGDALTDNARRGLVGAYLADRRIDDAFKIATVLLKPEGKLVEDAVKDPLVLALFQAVRDAIDQGRKEDAGKLLAGLRTLLASAISAELDADLIKLQEAIDREPPPVEPNPPAEIAVQPAAS